MPHKPKSPNVKTPKAPKPWDIRPKGAKGSTTADEVYRAVGMALTSWESIEVVLADIFTIFVGAPLTVVPHAPATMAYGSIIGFRSRASMIEAAASGFFQACDGNDALDGFGRKSLRHKQFPITRDPS
jgi:hypothetical protein